MTEAALLQRSKGMRRGSGHSFSASRDARRGWLLSLPSVILALILLGAPIVLVIINGLRPSGIDALKSMVGVNDFGQVVLNTVVWTAISVVGAMVLGYAVALLLQHHSVRLRGVWRGLFLLPWIMPGVVSATLWQWYYDGEFGYLNEVLSRLGIEHHPIYWLLNTSIVLPAVSLIQVWSTFPFVMLLVSAALQAIPGDIYEAARLDGASYRKIVRFIILPNLSDVTFLSLLITAVWAINSFTIIWVMTSGGPAGATTTIPVEIYNAFQAGDYSTVYAVALLELVATMALAAVYIRRTRPREAAV